MMENTGAAQAHFTPDELSKFNTELTAIKMEGERLPQFVLAMSGVEAPEKK